jgi:hypothetical protein
VAAVFILCPNPRLEREPRSGLGVNPPGLHNFGVDVTSLESTIILKPINTDSKPLTGNLTCLESTVTKIGGRRVGADRDTDRAHP